MGPAFETGVGAPLVPMHPTSAVRPLLRLALLGDFRLFSGAEAVRLRGRKARAMLAYLAVTPGRTVSRDRAADLLWSDRGIEQARGSLRQMLAELRACPPIDAALVIARDAFGFAAGAVVSDVEAILAAAERQDPRDLAEQLGAVGDGFLTDMAGVSPAFDDWLRIERVGQPERVNAAVCAVVPLMIGCASPVQIQDILRALERLDPWNEAIARLGFEADHALGDVASLHRRYRRLYDGLREELGVEPSAETRMLFDRLVATGTPDVARVAVADVARPMSVPPTILISPIESITDLPASRDIAGILTDDIRTALATYREVRIVALEASTVGGVEDHFAGALVAYLLSGKVRQIGTDIRVNLQLGNIGNGTVVWSEQLTIRQDNLVVAIDQVVAKTVGSILPAIDLDLSSLPELPGYEGADDVVHYAKARRLIGLNRNLGELQDAAAILEALIERNPEHVQAATWLARMYNTDFWQKIAGHDVAAYRARALDLARRVVAIAPGDARLLLRLSWCHLRSRNWVRAERGFRQAVTTLPHHADSLNEAAFGLCHLGELDAAESLMQRAFALHPFAPAHYHADHAMLLMLKGEAQAAEDHFEVCGERGLQYLAARIVNATRLPGGDRAESAALRSAFATDFALAWQPDRVATLADVLAWVGDTLPFRRPEHAALLTDGLTAALGQGWQAGPRKAG